MNPETLEIMRAAQTAVHRLVAACQKNGPLYPRSPKSVAQVNRTSKWLLNAISRLRHELDVSTEASGS